VEESRSCSAPRRGSLVGRRVEIRGDLERRERMAHDDVIFSIVSFGFFWFLFWIGDVVWLVVTACVLASAVDGRAGVLF